MRFIYLDEAGISASEPVAVVSGVIIDADRDWMNADKLLRGLIDGLVPPHFREGFIFHAKSIWGDKKYREGWELAQRLELIHGVLEIPRVLGLPIAMGCAHKDQASADLLGPKVHEGAHTAAFMGFVSAVDGFIVAHARENEIATLIAEDSPKMREQLRGVFRVLKAGTGLTASLFTSNGPQPVSKFMRASRIVDTVHFVDKQSGPLLQIADACAFSFRRFLSGQSKGAEFVKSLLGHDLDIAMFSEGWPSGVWFPDGISASADQLQHENEARGH